MHAPATQRRLDLAQAPRSRAAADFVCLNVHLMSRGVIDFCHGLETTLLGFEQRLSKATGVIAAGAESVVTEAKQHRRDKRAARSIPRQGGRDGCVTARTGRALAGPPRWRRRQRRASKRTTSLDACAPTLRAPSPLGGRPNLAELIRPMRRARSLRALSRAGLCAWACGWGESPALSYGVAGLTSSRRVSRSTEVTSAAISVSRNRSSFSCKVSISSSAFWLISKSSIARRRSTIDCRF
jgi:hypothetical protein